MARKRSPRRGAALTAAALALSSNLTLAEPPALPSFSTDLSTKSSPPALPSFSTDLSTGSSPPSDSNSTDPSQGKGVTVENPWNLPGEKPLPDLDTEDIDTGKDEVFSSESLRDFAAYSGPERLYFVAPYAGSFAAALAFMPQNLVRTLGLQEGQPASVVEEIVDDFSNKAVDAWKKVKYSEGEKNLKNIEQDIVDYFTIQMGMGETFSWREKAALWLESRRLGPAAFLASFGERIWGQVPATLAAATGLDVKGSREAAKHVLSQVRRMRAEIVEMPENLSSVETHWKWGWGCGSDYSSYITFLVERFSNLRYEDYWSKWQKFVYRREQQIPGFRDWIAKKLDEYSAELEEPAKEGEDK